MKGQVVSLVVNMLLLPLSPLRPAPSLSMSYEVNVFGFKNTFSKLDLRVSCICHFKTLNVLMWYSQLSIWANIIYRPRKRKRLFQNCFTMTWLIHLLRVGATIYHLVTHSQETLETIKSHECELSD